MTLKNRGIWILATLVALGASLGAAGAYRGGCSVVPMAKSELARDTRPEVLASDVPELVAANSRFAVDAYRALGRTYAGQNVLLSPYSISVSLAMTYAGAGGQTATEMATAIHWALPPERLHRAFDALDLQLASRATGVVALQLADSIWAPPGLRFEKPFLDTLAQSYGTGVRLADFAGDPEGSRRRINEWVADETNRKIQDLVAAHALHADTAIALVNAVYFHADWSTPFDKAATKTDRFWRLDGGPIAVQMMHNEHLRAACAQTSAYDAVELPFVDHEIAMDVVMPKPGSFVTFESEQTAEELARIFGTLQGDSVVLSMPRFRFAGSSFGLKALLQGLGMRLAFDRLQANFSAMATDPHGPLYVEDVLHQAYMAVDEKGTEAAAATAVIQGVGAGRPSDKVVIRIDHPFFFVLRHLPTNTILFAGRLVNPADDPGRR
jgi:serpin B